MKVVVPQTGRISGCGVGFDLIPEPINDHEYNGKIVEIMVGEDVNFGDLVYFKSDSKLWKANAIDDTKIPTLGLVLESISANNRGKILLYGFIRDDSWSWNVGLLFTGFIDGSIIQIDPDLLLTGNQVQVIGFATHPNIILFKPDLSIDKINETNSGDSGTYSDLEKLNIELEMSFNAAKINNYRELSYIDGDLIAITIYETPTKLVTLFDKVLTYNLGNLTKIVLTRHSDGVKLIKDLTYDMSGNLFSINQTKI